MQVHWKLRNAATVGKATTAVLAAVFIIAMTSFASLAASDFVGTWNVKDTAGEPFEITLSGDGAAKASRGEGMVGTWKEEAKAAVIEQAVQMANDAGAHFIMPIHHQTFRFSVEGFREPIERFEAEQDTGTHRAPGNRRDIRAPVNADPSFPLMG